VRLRQETARLLPPTVLAAEYDRAQPVGIVHFGIGAFHRAHQAWYTNACLGAGESGWMIVGVSTRSRTVAQQLNPQDGLYTLTERSSSGSSTRAVGAVQEVLLASEDRKRVIARVASSECHVVSFTVTEKGYCRRPDGSLDLELASTGFYPLVTEALAARRAGGLPGVTLLSCDNLSRNGRQLNRLFGEYLAYAAPDLIGWFEDRCATPDSMVDRIVPATTQEDLAELQQRIGMIDEGAVFTEPFSQWVIEDRFAGARPLWERQGAQLVADVAPYETAKLRMLNGAHSLIAYVGLDRGHTYVHQAIADPVVRHLTQQLLLDEAAPTIDAAPGQDLHRYAEALLQRFANPALEHKLIQIAMDGSQKIPQRWLTTVALNAERDCACPAILTGIAHWLRHVRGDSRPVEDPLADELRRSWIEHGKSGIVEAVFGSDGLFRQWRPSARHVALIKQAMAATER
jgi:fructuronate reductase